MAQVKSAHGETDDLEQLRKDVMLGWKIGIVTFSGLAAMTFREHGTADLYNIWQRLLGGAQSDRLREGMRRLGIREDEPPAVQAAKYHFFSNNLGGLNLEYIEESPKKVWIRYRTPYYMMPGLSAIAFPATLRRAQFSAWHPKNRHFLGYPRLGWVYTKTPLEGDPYDEGYFIEYDHDITDAEADGSAVVTSTPEYDPAKAPKLDPQEWPEARRLKARRNYAMGYAAQSFQLVMSIYGQLEARHMIEKTSRILAAQYGHEWINDLQIHASDMEAVVELLTGMLSGLGQEFTVTRVSKSLVKILHTPSRGFEQLTTDLRQAYFSLYETTTRHISGRMRVEWHLADGGKVDEWTVEDVGRWIW
jgi:hypothetical protein